MNEEKSKNEELEEKMKELSALTEIEVMKRRDKALKKLFPFSWPGFICFLILFVPAIWLISKSRTIDRTSLGSLLVIVIAVLLFLNTSIHKIAASTKDLFLLNEKKIDELKSLIKTLKRPNK